MGRRGRGTSTTSPDAPTTAPATAGALLRRALRRNGRELGRGYPLLTLWQLSETLVPVVIGLVVDQAVDGGGLGDLAWTLGVLVALFVVLSNGYRFGARFIKQGIEREAPARPSRSRRPTPTSCRWPCTSSATRSRPSSQCS